MDLSHPLPPQSPVLVLIVAMFAILAMQWPVAQVCRRSPAIAQWRPVLILASFFWGGMLILKFIFLRDYWTSDAQAHEAASREIAEYIRSTGIQSASEFFGAGNYGFRYLLGILYAYTNSPHILVTAWFTYLAFSGMLILLDVVVRSTGAVRVQFWLVFLICFYPEAIFWCIDLLKEGPVMWGVCTMLQLIVPDPNRNTFRYKLWFFFGSAVAMLLRPHITFAWLVAMGITKALKPSQFGWAIIIGGCAAASFLFMRMLAPSLIDAALSGSTVQSFEQGFRAQLADPGGSAIRYIAGVPTPIVSGMILLFLRPFPQEAPHTIGFFAGAEVWFLTTTMIVSWLFLKNRRRYLKSPLVLSSLLTILFLSFFFSYLYNMGLMVRQRMQAFPALVTLAATPGLARRSPSFNHGQARLPRAYAAPLGRFPVPGRMVARPVSFPRSVVPRPRFR